MSELDEEIDIVKEAMVGFSEPIAPANNQVQTKPIEDLPVKIITEDALLGIYGEIMDNLRTDRAELTGYIDTFAEAIVNDGDATTSSKEAFVNLLKIKTDLNDKQAKIADLMTRVVLKERDTYKPYLNNNTINISADTNKRDLLKHIDRVQKKKKEKK